MVWQLCWMTEPCKPPIRKFYTNRPFPSCFEPHYEIEAKCKAFVLKISFHSNANKTNFHMNSFALSLSFIVRFTATRKWPIYLHPDESEGLHWDAGFSAIRLK